MLPRSADARLAFACITEGAAVLVPATEAPRGFGTPRTLTSLRRGSGIVAADVDGDHLLDLVLVSGGSLGVMKAALEEP